MLSEPREARIEKSTFTLTSAAPRQIDLTTKYVGKEELIKTEAIYRIDDQCLEYCVAAPGQPRPTEFATRIGDGLTLAKLRRVNFRGSR